LPNRPRARLNVLVNQTTPDPAPTPESQLISVRIVNHVVPFLPARLAYVVTAVMDGYQTSRARQLFLLAAGLAYHAFLAIFPALVAGVLLFGLFADPDEIIAMATRATTGLPAEAQDLMVDQVKVLVNQPENLGAGLVVAVVVAVVSASSGISNLMTAVNAIYGIVQKRGYFTRRLISFAAMLGAVVFMVVMLGLVAVVPAVISFVDIGVPRWVVEVVRWLVTAIVFAASLSLIYRFFPENPPPTFRWASLGAGIATLLFLIASAGYSFYISSFSSLSATYGTLAGIVITLIWFWMLSFAVLLGAQINVEVANRSIKAREAAEDARRQETPSEPGAATQFGRRVVQRVEEELERRADKRAEHVAVEPSDEPSGESSEKPSGAGTGDSVGARSDR
jgi:membrane protein